jgi:3-deoxy-D-manno-octulosonate 8-phosphate phosphatase (KDO 8-P phosphatase)
MTSEIPEIKIIAMDVDGTLTDGKIYMGMSGEVMKVFSIKDGLGIVKARVRGLIPVIITGRTSEIVSRRASELGIADVIQGVDDKVKAMREVAQKYNVDFGKIAFIGDDENDIDVMKFCAFASCPADAVDSVKQECDYICETDGGDGAVREVIEFLLANKVGR